MSSHHPVSPASPPRLSSLPAQELHSLRLTPQRDWNAFLHSSAFTWAAFSPLRGLERSHSNVITSIFKQDKASLLLLWLWFLLQAQHECLLGAYFLCGQCRLAAQYEPTWGWGNGSNLLLNNVHQTELWNKQQSIITIHKIGNKHLPLSLPWPWAHSLARELRPWYGMWYSKKKKKNLIKINSYIKKKKPTRSAE